MYGYQRVVNGTDRGGYYHELFLLGRPDFAKIMLRTRVRVTLNAERSNSWEGEDPDFYAYPFCRERKEPTLVPHSKQFSDDSSYDNITLASQTWDTNEDAYSHPKSAVRVSPHESLSISDFEPPSTKQQSKEAVVGNTGHTFSGSSWSGPPSRLNFVLKPLPRAPRLITPSAVSLSRNMFGHPLAQFEGQTFQCIDDCSLEAMESILIAENLF